TRQDKQGGKVSEGRSPTLSHQLRARMVTVRLATVEKGLDERPSGRARPVARSRHAADQSPLAVDEVCGRWPPYAVGLAGHVPALVQKDRCHVAAFAYNLTNVVWLLTEIHQQDLQ